MQLSGSTQANPTLATTYGSTGLRFLGNLGAGFRILLSERFALRLEIRDLVYTARVDSINGCDATDLTNIPSGGPVSSGCNSSTFTGKSGTASTALNIAQRLVGDNSSDVVNNIIFFAGLSYLF